MSAAVQPVPNQRGKIDGVTFGDFKNPEAGKSWFDHTVSWLREGSAIYRFFKFLSQICKMVAMILKQIGSAVANAAASVAEGLADRFTQVWTWLAIPRIPEVTQKAWKALKEWGEPVGGFVKDSSRGVVQRAQSLFDCAATWLYGLSLVTGSSALKDAADIPAVANDATEAMMAVEDYQLNSKRLEVVQANKKKLGFAEARFQAGRDNAFWLIIKTVTAVVSGILGLLALALGGPLLPAPALLCLGLISTIAAITSVFHKKAAEPELVEFFKGPKAILANKTPIY